MNKILDVMEDIKQNITDNQYKTIMDSLMEIHKNKEEKFNNESTSYKSIALLNWLDTKLELTDDSSDLIKKKDLYIFIITEYFNGVYYEYIKDFMKQVLKLFFMHEKNYQNDQYFYIYVKYKIL